MIFPSCREQNHISCKELARQVEGGLTATERAGSAWCDCQHMEGS